MEEVLVTLSKIKGMLLLSATGLLYILEAYEYESNKIVEEKKWFRTVTTKHSYISKLSFNVGFPKKYTHTRADQIELSRDVNVVIADRNRYLRMLKSLSDSGYTIRKKL
jgi:hypothetical protein